MKIAHVQHPYLPNLGYQENYLPFRQADLGHEVHLISSNRVPPKFTDKYSDNQLMDSHEKDGVQIHRLNCRYIVKSVEDVFLDRLQTILNEIKPDVLHSHGLITMKSIQTFYHKFKYNTDTKLFIDMHRDNGNFDTSSIHNSLLYYGFKTIFLPVLKKYTNCFLPVNPYSEDLLTNELSIDPTQVELLPLGVNKQEFSPNKHARRRIREELNIKASDQLLIFAGHIEESKRLTETISALGNLNDNLQSEAVFLIIGSGNKEYIEKLHSTASKAGVAENIRFKEFVDHHRLSEYFNAADIGIWAGKLGITVLEAVSCGLPVIVSDDPATSLVVGNDNGLTYAEGNVNDLAEKMQKYLTDQSLKKEHGIKGRQLVEDQLSWEKIATKSIEYYQSY